jgi:hypothetical protein
MPAGSKRNESCEIEAARALFDQIRAAAAVAAAAAKNTSVSHRLAAARVVQRCRTATRDEIHARPAAATPHSQVEGQ